jgi:NAD(P)-dependent dehydrogenase (short-subunit alcohol dehydrogenase family)
MYVYVCAFEIPLRRDGTDKSLGKSLAVEWVGFARANTVSPGYMVTEISSFAPSDTKNVWRTKTPMGREGECHELKGAFLYLASDASSYTIDLLEISKHSYFEQKFS